VVGHFSVCRVEGEVEAEGVVVVVVVVVDQ